MFDQLKSKGKLKRKNRKEEKEKKKEIKMVLLHIKRGNESQFLYEIPSSIKISQLNQEIVSIYNGRLKVKRICSEMEELAKHGPMFCPEIIGLTDEQVTELKLIDEWQDKVCPSGGWVYNRDPCGRRNGRQPQENMQEVLRKAISDAREMISQQMIEKSETLTLKQVQEAIDILRGAVTIVYPMNLPPHDPIRMEFSNTENLSGTQASREVIDPVKMELWFAGRQLLVHKYLYDYLSKNEKCKAILKIGKKGDGPPGREPIFDEKTQKQIMLQQYRRQEELKKLDDDEDDAYLDSNWANNSSLKQKLHGVENISFRFSK